MSERLENLVRMGLPAAVLQALTPRSPSLAQPEPPRRMVNAAPADVDRYTGGGSEREPARDDTAVVSELRSIARLHQAQQAARKAA